jgi:hypothetical protein
LNLFLPSLTYESSILALICSQRLSALIVNNFERTLGFGVKFSFSALKMDEELVRREVLEAVIFY